MTPVADDLPVAVVIPALNAERFIASAIESVLAQRAALELIVVDDGSSDATREIVERYRPHARVLRSEGAGPGAARNHGIRNSESELIAFLDADDAWVAGSLALRTRALAENPAIDLAFGHTAQFRDGEPRSTPPQLHAVALPSAAVIRREVFRRVGMFREDLVAGEFIDWMRRAHDAGARELMLAEHVVWRRVHDDNLGVRRRSESRAALLRVVKASLDQRRAAAGPPP